MAKERKEKRCAQGFTRVASEGDLDFLEKLSYEAFSIYGDYGEIVPRWLSNPNVLTLMYVNDVHPVGFAMFSVPSGEILAIAVMPQYQRTGIGSALLRRITGLASQLGLTRLTVHTADENAVAQLFFQKAGFEVIGSRERYYPQGQTALVMSRSI